MIQMLPNCLTLFNPTFHLLSEVRVPHTLPHFHRDFLHSQVPQSGPTLADPEGMQQQFMFWSIAKVQNMKRCNTPSWGIETVGAAAELCGFY